ncbi:hypothetical protein [Caenispirillum bisanense]|uniref:hypothetical protein n=1 Tax=Caenispirillum bisanense TaxID=414052 RepID=UPI0031CECBDA
MADEYLKQWQGAKAAFERATGKKKPSGKFLGIFSRSGMADACRGLDKAADGDAATMEKALAAFKKTATAYEKELVAAEKADSNADYKKEVQKLVGEMDTIETLFRSALEEKLPVNIRLPNAISRSDNVFGRVKSKQVELKPVSFTVGFAETSVRLAKMVEDEIDGLVQTLITRCSNKIRDLEEELATYVDSTAPKAVAAKDKDKAVQAMMKECTNIIARYRVDVDAMVDSICKDWFTKFKIASDYKKGFAFTVVKGVVGITLSVTATVLTGGAALAVILPAIATNGKTLVTMLSATYKYARDIATTEEKLIEANKEVVEMYETATRAKVEWTEFQSFLGAPWVNGIQDLSKTTDEYTKKCVDYEKKVLPQIRTKFRELEKQIGQVADIDAALARKLSAAYDEAFEAVANENKVMEKRMDLRIKARSDVEVLTATRPGVIKLYKIIDGGSNIASAGSAVKNLVSIVTALI